jgi:hypothetical protein
MLDSNLDREGREDTKKSPTWLQEHKRSIYSQTGEDGIIEKILEVLPQNDKWCVEFGASDGLQWSNTRNLIENKGYSAILIEGSKTKFKKLERNYSQNTRVTTINRFVGFGEEDSLDQILKGTPLPIDFDFLCIDIDGNDYHVWKAISKYKPKLICIEFNPTIPTHVRFIQPADPSVSQGSSLLSIVELGKEKGYELVSVLFVNAFFVRSEYYSLFQIESNDPEVLRTDLNGITYLFFGYDGKVFLHGNLKLIWHDIDLKESKIQPLPRFLRRFPGNYTKLHKIVFNLYLLFTDPHNLIKRIIRLTKRCTCDIKANNSDGPISITTTDVLKITVSLEPGKHEGKTAKYIVAFSPKPADWYHYDYANRSWEKGFDVSHIGPLANVSSLKVLERSGLPVGEYTFFFSIRLDTGRLYSDSVKVYIIK